MLFAVIRGRGGGGGHVGLLVGGARQEVEDGAVVPEPEGAAGLPAGDVGSDPRDRTRRRADPGRGLVERGRREVDDRDVGVAPPEQLVDQARGAALLGEGDLGTSRVEFIFYVKINSWSVQLV